jgi:pimeloyl-ACP methyl ester carboxylesterase
MLKIAWAWRAVLAPTVVACLLLAGAPAALASTQTITVPYSGYNIWTGKCSESQTVYVTEPVGGGTYPVFIYLHSTGADHYSDKEGQAVDGLVAPQGYLAAAVKYDSSLTIYSPHGMAGHANCIFNPSSATSAVSQVCALAEAACSHGLMVAGFSQGGAIALVAKNYDPNVDSVWSIGVTGYASWSAQYPPPAGTRALPSSDLIINDGQQDVTHSGTLSLADVQAFTGDNCGPTTLHCLQADGSGYYIVGNSEVADGVADHCYWMQAHSLNPYWSCTSTPTFDPGFAPPSTLPWSLNANLAFLASRLH